MLEHILLDAILHRLVCFNVEYKKLCITPADQFFVIVAEVECFYEFEVSLVLVVFGVAADPEFVVDSLQQVNRIVGLTLIYSDLIMGLVDRINFWGQDGHVLAIV